jgi:tetratricopeptide (TPR) repeat protein
MWKGFVTLRLSTKAASADQLIGHLGQDPLDYARPRDPDLFYEPLPSLQPVTDAFVEALQTEVYAPRLKAALGVVLVHQGRLKDGRRALDAARKQEERNEAAMFYLGLIEFQEGNTSKAAAFWKAVQSIDSGKGVYYQFLGEALMKLDRLAAAVADFERGLAKGATHPWARSQLAAALAKSGDKERAITQLQKAASDDPTAIEPRWQRFDLEL